MSIAAFFRTPIPCVQAYTYMLSGRPVTVYTEVNYVNANVQPYKQGNTFVLGGEDLAGLFYYTNYQTVYTKSQPVLPYPADALPPGATLLTQGKFYFWYKRKWFVKVGDQDWTECGRNPKHYKWFGTASSDVPAVPDPLDPITVSDFEAVVNKLHIVNVFKVQPINNYP